MTKPKKCSFCPHTRAAHTDGMRCVLCECLSRPRTLVQESLAFRSAIPLRRTASSRKR